MKKIFFSALLCSVVMVSCSEETVSKEGTTTDQMTMKSSKFSNATLRGWSKAGNCLRGYGDCAIAIVSDQYLGEENGMPVTLTIKDNAQLVIDNSIKKVNEDGDKLTFSGDFTLPVKIADELGYSSVTIKAGEYDTKYDVNVNGQTVIEVLLE